MIFPACLLIAVFLLAGCSEKIVNGGNDANVTIALSTKMLSPGDLAVIDRYELEVWGEDFGSIIVPMVPQDPQDGFIVAKVEVESGLARRFVARALDKDGIILYQGEDTADIEPDVQVELNIDLFPVVPMVNLTPHYQYVQLNDSFYVDISVFNVRDIVSIDLDFSRNDSPLNFMRVERGLDYGDTVGVWYETSESYFDYTIGVYHTQGGSLVDASGYAHLARVWFRSYRDWATDTATVLFQVQPTYVYTGVDTIVPVGDIYTDGAMVELYWEEPPPIPTWEKTIGGAGDDIGHCVCPAHNGNFIIVGETSSFGAGLSDVYLAEVDQTGGVVWSQTYGAAGTDIGYSAIATDDGGYVIAGESNSFAPDQPSDFYLVKTDGAGNLSWQKTYSGGDIESSHSVLQTADGGFIITGTRVTDGGSDIYAVKTNLSGDSVWARRYYTEVVFAQGQSVALAPGGGFVFVGSAGGGDAGDNILIVFADSLGNQTNQKPFDNDTQGNAIRIAPAIGGGYIIIGNTSSKGAGMNDIYVVKMDINGTFRWTKTYGLAGQDFGFGISPTRDLGFILVGGTQTVGAQFSNVDLRKIDANGAQKWYMTYGGTGDDVGYCVKPADDGGYIAVGYTTSSGAGGKDIYLIKTDSDGLVSPPELNWM